MRGNKETPNEDWECWCGLLVMVRMGEVRNKMEDKPKRQDFTNIRP